MEATTVNDQRNINATSVFTDASLYEFDHPANYLISIITGVIGSVGVPGNVFLLFLISKNFKNRKPYEWLIFNLALIDTFMCLNNALLQAPFIINYKSVACKVAGFVEYFFGSLSMTVPPTVAFNRYLSLHNLAQYKIVFTARNVALMCAIPYFISALVFLPAVISNSLGIDEQGLCGIRLTSTIVQVLMVLIGAIMSLSNTICVYCGYKIIRKIRDHKAGLASDIQSRVVNESKELVTLFSILLAIPMVAQMPSLVVKVMQISMHVDPWISRSITSLFSLTSACNPYLTMWIVKDYRKAVKMIVFDRSFGPSIISVQPYSSGDTDFRTNKIKNAVSFEKL